MFKLQRADSFSTFIHLVSQMCRVSSCSWRSRVSCKVEMVFLNSQLVEILYYWMPKVARKQVDPHPDACFNLNTLVGLFCCPSLATKPLIKITCQYLVVIIWWKVNFYSKNNEKCSFRKDSNSCWKSKM